MMKVNSKNACAMVYAGCTKIRIGSRVESLYVVHEMRCGTLSAYIGWDFFERFILGSFNQWTSLDRDFLVKVQRKLNQIPDMERSSIGSFTRKQLDVFAESIMSQFKPRCIVGYTNKTWNFLSEYIRNDDAYIEAWFWKHIETINNKLDIGANVDLCSGDPIFSGSVWHPHNADGEEVETFGNSISFHEVRNQILRMNVDEMANERTDTLRTYEINSRGRSLGSILSTRV